MAKNKNDYFKLAQQQAEFCVQASELLEEILCNYSVDNIAEQHEKMHVIENKADELHHDILTRLSAEFITPIDQEDILHLVQIIDDVTDALDEVVLECYMFHINEMPQGVDEFSKTVNRCVKALSTAIKELKNFKKPDTLRRLLVEVNTVEGEADVLYAQAIHKIFVEETDTKKLIINKSVFESLESCCDLCEHAADIVELIIIKNT